MVSVAAWAAGAWRKIVARQPLKGSVNAVEASVAVGCWFITMSVSVRGLSMFRYERLGLAPFSGAPSPSSNAYLGRY